MRYLLFIFLLSCAKPQKIVYFRVQGHRSLYEEKNKGPIRRKWKRTSHYIPVRDGYHSYFIIEEYNLLFKH